MEALPLNDALGSKQFSVTEQEDTCERTQLSPPALGLNQGTLLEVPESDDEEEESESVSTDNEGEEIDLGVDVACLEQACRSVMRDLNTEIWRASKDYGVPIGVLASMVEDFFLYQSQGLPPRPPDFFVEDARLWPELAENCRQRRLLVERCYVTQGIIRPKFLIWQTDVEGLSA
jgi:hypothetical protein